MVILFIVSWLQVTMRSRKFSLSFALHLLGSVISCERKFSSRSEINECASESFSYQLISGKLKSLAKYNGFLVSATAFSIFFWCWSDSCLSSAD